MPPLLADLPFPEEALIPIILVVAQLFAWLKEKKNKELEEAPPEIDEKWREVVWENQTRDPNAPKKPVFEDSRVEEMRDVEPHELFFETPEYRDVIIEPEPEPEPVRPIAIDVPLVASAPITPKKRRRGQHARAALLRNLASPSSTRDAIVLAEVLGPPRGSQS